MRVVALVKSHDHVCCRYRLAAYKPIMAEAGYRLELRNWPQFYLSRLLLKRQLGTPDVLILQRRMPSPWQLSMLKQLAGHVIYDFDDALFLRDSFSPRGLYCPRLEEKFSFTVKSVDIVVAGNPFLVDQVRMVKDDSHVVKIPTCLDPAKYELARHQHEKQLEMVWIGSSSTLPGLRLLTPVLESLGRKHPHRQLKIICDRSFKLRSLKVKHCQWAEQAEAAELAAADIGISWMPDDLWSQGKCGLKVLQYMAAGLPVIANAAGIQRELVRHGETGFLVNTLDEFVQAVETLEGAPELRRHMGRAGRRLVEKEYHVSVGGKHWLQLLNQLAQSGGPKEPDDLVLRSE